MRNGALTPGPSPVHGRGGERVELSPTLRLPKASAATRESARRLRAESTRPEEVLWIALRNGQLDGRKFRRQHPVGGFVLDFYCHQEHLAIEIDGSVHETTIEQDRERQAILESLGIRVLRLTAELVEEDLDSAIKRIRETPGSSASPPLPRTGEGAGR
ncbi:MAG: endonuclease domain-containing protein [Chloroflexi bacterium]|nr:endonuclease domain-containing protein [Chloroflexota bacterium]